MGSAGPLPQAGGAVSQGNNAPPSGAVAGYAAAGGAPRSRGAARMPQLSVTSPRGPRPPTGGPEAAAVAHQRAITLPRRPHPLPRNWEGMRVRQ